jgi:hypothetical protein
MLSTSHRLPTAAPGYYSNQARRDRHDAHLLVRMADRLSALRGELCALVDQLDQASSKVALSAYEELSEAHIRLVERAAALRGEKI